MAWAPRAPFFSSFPLDIAISTGGARGNRSTTILLASSSGTRESPLSPRINGSKASRGKQQNPPSIAEVQRAIGVNADDSFRPTGRSESSSSSLASSSSPLMEMLSSTPIGREEGPNERKLREAAEWMVDRTEANALVGQKILLVVCLQILPVWVLLLLVASGIIKLPFDLPLMDDLIS